MNGSTRTRSVGVGSGHADAGRGSESPSSGAPSPRTDTSPVLQRGGLLLTPTVAAGYGSNQRPSPFTPTVATGHGSQRSSPLLTTIPRERISNSFAMPSESGTAVHQEATFRAGGWQERQLLRWKMLEEQYQTASPLRHVSGVAVSNVESVALDASFTLSDENGRSVLNNSHTAEQESEALQTVQQSPSALHRQTWRDISQPWAKNTASSSSLQPIGLPPQPRYLSTPAPLGCETPTPLGARDQFEKLFRQTALARHTDQIQRHLLDPITATNYPVGQQHRQPAQQESYAAILSGRPSSVFERPSPALFHPMKHVSQQLATTTTSIEHQPAEQPRHTAVSFSLTNINNEEDEDEDDEDLKQQRDEWEQQYITSQQQRNVFRPMSSVPTSVSRSHWKQAEENLYKLLIAGFSPNYKGNPLLDRNRSAPIPAEHNCSLFIIGLAPDLTTRDLIASIHNVGRVYATHINGPEPDKGHMTSAAKVIFFERAAAERFYNRHALSGFIIQNSQGPYYKGRVVWNRIRSAETDVGGRKSRVLLISGPPDFVNETVLRGYFSSKLTYQVEHVGTIDYDPAARGGPRRLIEFRFGSYRCQAEAARMALTREMADHGVICEFGHDPCDVDENH
ncbi:hypothetical protein B0H63DRAFT_539275 [Podospora didyma]|uniref:Uncharacterized protein n=1 Tax=Podospora didyma TaxID=330526 RepID=A0AAE0U4S9_9PEZI|nr:hypothetical protein B0H63DRAFT_539275 [Podospora didyma]